MDSKMKKPKALKQSDIASFFNVSNCSSSKQKMQSPTSSITLGSLNSQEFSSSSAISSSNQNQPKGGGEADKRKKKGPDSSSGSMEKNGEQEVKEEVEGKGGKETNKRKGSGSSSASMEQNEKQKVKVEVEAKGGGETNKRKGSGSSSTSMEQNEEQKVTVEVEAKGGGKTNKRKRKASDSSSAPREENGEEKIEAKRDGEANKRKRKGSDSISASREENGEKEEVIDLNAKLGKRRSAENAAKLIKPCVRAEDTSKRNIPVAKPLVFATSKSGTDNISNVVQQKKSELMWVDKYKPVLVKNIVGQVGEKSNASKLMKWLQNWFTYHGKSNEKVRAAAPGLFRDPEGKTFKAALLSGPPGIGKTTTAHLCCKQIGYDYFELNASDTRNKKGLHNMLSDCLTSEALTGFKDKSRRHILIMDEVDGMSGNEDRGGIQEVINLIKASRVPIICVCNDRMHPKIRSLANYCYDLRFNKPTNEQMKAMIQSICFKEKMKLPVEPVLQLINSTDHDIRQILHQLQLIKESSTPGNSLYNPRKDLKFGPWDICRKVFSAHEHKGMSIHDKSNLFFHDYSIGPLFVQENYVKWIPIAAKGNRFKHMDLIKMTAETIATGDLVDNLLRRTNNWSLLPTQAVFASILPGEYMEGTEPSGMDFPQWLGKNSSYGKMRRLLQQLHNHVHLQVSGSLEALNMDYLPYLRRAIVNPLVKGEVNESAELMQTYNLQREDLDSIIDVTTGPGDKNPMDRVDTKTKSAFTRQVNKEILPYSTVKISKGRGQKVEGEEDMEGLEEEEDGDEAEIEEEEEDLQKDAMIKVRAGKKKTESLKAKSEPKPSTSKSKGGAGNSRAKTSGRVKK